VPGLTQSGSHGDASDGIICAPERGSSGPRAVTLTPVSLMTLVLLFVGGIAALIAGANLLVRGASSLAAAFGIPPLVIGLTVVAFGTSSPELAVSVQSAWSGQTDIAVGNAVGSNIFNVLFILGLSALVAPLVVAEQLVRKEVPVMIGASALLLLLATGGVISRAEGAVLFGGVVAIRSTLSSRRAARAAPTPRTTPGNTVTRRSGAGGTGLSRSRSCSPAWRCWCWGPPGSWTPPCRRHGCSG
jgi:hypothetical protein